MTILTLLAGMALTVLLALIARRWIGFTAQTPADYRDHAPAFDPRTHLCGPIQCEGVIYGPTGRVASRFVADMHGSWDGAVGTLREDFRYDSGLEQARCWTLHLGNDGDIRALAPDVPGEGSGQVSGSSVVLRYKIQLAPSAGGHVLDVTDWMYLMENGTILNRSQFFKWGIKVAELVATMRPKTKGAVA
jgi:hypothetical protein